MKSFSQVYNRSKVETLNEQKETALKERSQLLSAMKKEFCINSFSECNEAQKKSYTNMINEMWNPNTGLTEAGHRFITASEIPLTESADDETVFKEIKRRLKSEEQTVLNCVFAGKECAAAQRIKSDVEKKIGRKIGVGEFKKIMVTLVGEYACRVIKSYKF